LFADKSQSANAFEYEYEYHFIEYEYEYEYYFIEYEYQRLCVKPVMTRVGFRRGLTCAGAFAPRVFTLA
jgi:hypothetical protein